MGGERSHHCAIRAPLNDNDDDDNNNNNRYFYSAYKSKRAKKNVLRDKYLLKDRLRS